MARRAVAAMAKIFMVSGVGRDGDFFERGIFGLYV